LLREQKIATMAELKRALGTAVDVTVFRKLKQLRAHTSYSHRGRYYTLEEIASFDAQGLWSWRDVWFSRYGTLLNTAEAFVELSAVGSSASELEASLHLEVKDALLRLLRQGRLHRQRLAGRYVYCSCDAVRRRQQLDQRRMELDRSSLVGQPVSEEIAPDELKAAIVLFFSLLDEKQRRLYAALESLKWGHGGDRKVAHLLGLDEGTVARGRHELLSREVESGRVRRAGAGRKAVKKKRRGDRPHPRTAKG
jgi:hypothetical protein